MQNMNLYALNKMAIKTRYILCYFSVKELIKTFFFCWSVVIFLDFVLFSGYADLFL